MTGWWEDYVEEDPDKFTGEKRIEIRNVRGKYTDEEGKGFSFPEFFAFTAHVDGCITVTVPYDEVTRYMKMEYRNYDEEY